MICKKYNNGDRAIAYKFVSEECLNRFITPFVIHSVFQYVGLLWIADDNNNYKFEIGLEDTQYTDKVPWYNATISKKLNGQSSKDYLKTG